MKLLELSLVLMFAVVDISLANNSDQKGALRLRFSIRNHEKNEVKTKNDLKGTKARKGKKLKRILNKVNGIEEQMRLLSKRLSNLTPQCRSNSECGEGMCCWNPKGKAGKCKMIPHRIGQRCTSNCGCSHGLYCHFMKNRNGKTKKHGKCFMKEKTFGIRNINYIPNMLEKIGSMEKVEEKKGKI